LKRPIFFSQIGFSKEKFAALTKGRLHQELRLSKNVSPSA